LRATAPRQPKHTFRSAALRGAYALLATVSIFTVALDHGKRRDAASAAPVHAQSDTGHEVPTPITPLADSPFLKKASPARIAEASPSDEVQSNGTLRTNSGNGNRG
jgi:hypothetical protein